MTADILVELDDALAGLQSRVTFLPDSDDRVTASVVRRLRSLLRLSRQLIAFLHARAQTPGRRDHVEARPRASAVCPAGVPVRVGGPPAPGAGFTLPQVPRFQIGSALYGPVAAPGPIPPPPPPPPPPYPPVPTTAVPS